MAAQDAFSQDWAHSPPEGSGKDPHWLDEHLQSVGRLAAAFAPERAQAVARLAGLWHDLGKRRPGFQAYIQRTGIVDAHIERVADKDKTHSAAGALWAIQHLEQSHGTQGKILGRLLQCVIAGHHAGLDNWEGGQGPGLSARLTGQDAQRELSEALARPQADDILKATLADIDLNNVGICNEHQKLNPGRFALWVRMVFSALVDADFLDTEAYMDVRQAEARRGECDLRPFRDELNAYLTAFGEPKTAVNRIRADVLAQCHSKASLPPGVFSLTVPTGGGKTLSSLAFALEHAVKHGKRRIVYAIPYTSIIEQTADVFREVFRALGEDAVIEHHSNAESNPEEETTRSRLACENWDAPLIVTTNVQLFESLFARKTSRCRKLHSLVNSVIVLDEAQLLPVEFLQPVVDVLRYLVQDFGVTVLLCTATQPALDTPPSVDPQRGLRRALGPVAEIIDDVPGLYRALERVRVHLPPSLETPRSWPELADEIAGHDAALTIVSRRADAAELFRLIKARADGARCWHLSALMCAQHRSDTIAEIKSALKARREALAAGQQPVPIHVVSTQLVEAGVDLDFPVVYRALAGLDSIAQAAGRCNREGKLPEPGAVHVFVPPTKAPPGLLTLARDTCKAVWRGLPADPFALPLIDLYFKRLYHDAPSTDKAQICDLLKLEPDLKAMSLPVQFRSAADAFKLIDEKDSATVLVRYSSSNARDDVDALIGMLERNGPARWLMRKLQRYGVTIYQHQVRRLVDMGDIVEVATCPGLYVQREGWAGFYDPVMGAKVDSAPGDPANYASS
ncbi:MAG: CRISPR-associated endonuclease Cas3'' [Burkholderiaceae bacterium]